METASECILVILCIAVKFFWNSRAPSKDMLKSFFLLQIIKQAVGLVIGVFAAMAHNSNLYRTSWEHLQSIHLVICDVCCVLFSNTDLNDIW